MNSLDVTPDTALLYSLMKRGSVLPSTFIQCVEQIGKGFEMDDPELVAKAHELTLKLWGSRYSHAP